MVRGNRIRVTASAMATSPFRAAGLLLRVMKTIFIRNGLEARGPRNRKESFFVVLDEPSNWDQLTLTPGELEMCRLSEEEQTRLKICVLVSSPRPTRKRPRVEVQDSGSDSGSSSDEPPPKRRKLIPRSKSKKPKRLLRRKPVVEFVESSESAESESDDSDADAIPPSPVALPVTAVAIPPRRSDPVPVAVPIPGPTHTHTHAHAFEPRFQSYSGAAPDFHPGSFASSVIASEVDEDEGGYVYHRSPSSPVQTTPTTPVAPSASDPRPDPDSEPTPPVPVADLETIPAAAAAVAVASLIQPEGPMMDRMSPRVSHDILGAHEADTTTTSDEAHDSEIANMGLTRRDHDVDVDAMVSFQSCCDIMVASEFLVLVLGLILAIWWFLHKS